MAKLNSWCQLLLESAPLICTIRSHQPGLLFKDKKDDLLVPMFLNCIQNYYFLKKTTNLGYIIIFFYHIKRIFMLLLQ